MNNSGYCFVRDFRKLKHTVNQVSPLRGFTFLSRWSGFAPLSRRDNTLLTVGEAQRNLRTLHVIYFTLLKNAIRYQCNRIKISYPYNPKGWIFITAGKRSAACGR
jgi:hypothetical protein